MFKEVKCRICSVKSMVILSGLLLIAVCAHAQAPDWLWAENAGGTISDYGFGIATDDSGNSYITGYFMDTAYFGAISLTSSGDDDIFVAKMDVNGNWLWAIPAGSEWYDESNGIGTDSNGNCYVNGCFEATATFGSTELISSGSKDIFVAKLDTDGNWLWAKRAGGTYNDKGYGIGTGSCPTTSIIFTRNMVLVRFST